MSEKHMTAKDTRAMAETMVPLPPFNPNVYSREAADKKFLVIGETAIAEDLIEIVQIHDGVATVELARVDDECSRILSFSKPEELEDVRDFLESVAGRIEI